MRRLLNWIRKNFIEDEFEEMERQWDKDTQIEMNYGFSREVILEIILPQIIKDVTEVVKDEIATEMLDNGFSIEDIEKCTGLSEDQINSLK